MPELPEVETVKNVLKKDLINLKITKVVVNYKDMIKTDLDTFLNSLINEKIVDIKRYGKWLVFETEHYDLVSHLRMEGKYYYTKPRELAKHEHVAFYFDNNHMLIYKDVRKFGVMFLVKKDKLWIDTPLAKLGLEPFNANLNANYLKVKFQSKRVPIKTALLDQEIMAGLGNIYADEVLFKSKVSPFKRANLLTEFECNNIIDASKEILKKAIEKGGTTIRSYTSSLGVEGSYQDYLLVHTKKVCPLCKNSIEVAKIGGRSTYYCKNCQKVDNE